MQKLISIFYKGTRRLIQIIRIFFENLLCKILLYFNNVEFQDVESCGVPYISVARGGACIIGKGFRINNNISSNPIGRNQPCIIFVDRDASLTIGDNVGMSATALTCHISINIGNNVKIGGGVCIYDTDFHSLDGELRNSAFADFQNKVNKPVKIGNNVFIGAHSTILKGVTIGDNAIIGTCSVVTKSIPANEIWAGNPAKLLRKIEVNDSK